MIPMIASKSHPQCLHLNSASQTRTLATLWPQLGQASHEFRRGALGSIYGSLSHLLLRLHASIERLPNKSSEVAAPASRKQYVTPARLLAVVQIGRIMCLHDPKQEV